MKKAWNRWIKLAELLGNFQMIILLSIIYWTMLAIIAIPFKVLADPLALRRPSGNRWQSMVAPPDRLESMRKQG